jgi:methionyl-tRNA formyltransferase
MPSQRLRIVFAGTPPFAASALQALLECPHAELVGVFTQPDRPSGRGRQLQATAVKTLALAHGLPVFQPQHLREAEERAPLAALAPDLLVVVAYGLILPRAVLELPRLGCINVHASLLPRWRGAAPIERAIEAGDAETGITIMQMDEGLDTGDMLYTVRCEIRPEDTGGSLRERLAGLGARALLEALAALVGETVTATPQDDRNASYAAKLRREEAVINWQEPCQVLARRVRAFNPANVCQTRLGDETVRIWNAMPREATAAGPGTIVAADRGGIVVACGQGSLALTELQMSGGKPMSAAALLNGRAALFAPGARFT